MSLDWRKVRRLFVPGHSETLWQLWKQFRRMEEMKKGYLFGVNAITTVGYHVANGTYIEAREKQGKPFNTFQPVVAEMFDCGYYFALCKHRGEQMGWDVNVRLLETKGDGK